MNTRLAEPRAHRLVNHALKPAAMDRELRDVIAGIEPARLAPYLLSETVGVEQFVGPDRHGVQPFEQAEFGQFLDGMRQCIDADAELPDGIRLLENFAVDPARMQHQRRHQAADARPCDDGLHDVTSQNTRVNLTNAQSAADNKKSNDLPLRHGYDDATAALALSARLSILPTPVRGSASTNAMCLGHLYLTRFSFAVAEQRAGVEAGTGLEDHKDLPPPRR